MTPGSESIGGPFVQSRALHVLIMIASLVACSGGSNDAPDGGVDASSADSASHDGAAIATVSVPMREALLVYARNRFHVGTDAEALTPYLAYVDQQGQVLESYLYDTFVFLDLDLIFTANPTVEGWRHFLDSFFETTPKPQIARPEVTQREGSQGALLAGDGQGIAQINIPVTGGEIYAWEVFTRASATVAGKEALVGFVVRDAQSNAIESGIAGLTWSTYLSQWYRYLPSSTRWQRHRGSFTLPANAVSLDIHVSQFNAPGEQIWVDRLQLRPGSTPLPFADAIAAGYDTLVEDGDFVSGASSSGFVAGDGLERALYMSALGKQLVAQGPIPVVGGSDYTLAMAVRADEASGDHEVVVGVRVFDSAGVEIVDGVSGLTYSTYTRPPMFYAYAEATTSWSNFQKTFALPAEAVNIEVYLVAWTGGGVWIDQVQLVAGAIALSESELKAAGYETLITDGSAEVWHGSAWWLRPLLVMPSGSGLLPALASVASAIGDTRKRNVILGIPVGTAMETQSEFGEVNGEWLDLTTVANRQAAVAWFIDEAVSRWSTEAPEGLDLVGFYWMHEAPSQDPTLAAFASAHAGSHGLLLTGSPYRKFTGGGPCFGSSFTPEFAAQFHRVWQQPNVWPPGRWSVTESVWNRVGSCLCEPLLVDEFVSSVGYPPCELAAVGNTIDELQTSSAVSASSAQVHANIEWVPGLEPTQGYGRVADYLNNDATLAHDFGRFEDRMWYEDAGFGLRCALDPDPVLRAQYDAVHDFILANRERHGFPAP